MSCAICGRAARGFGFVPRWGPNKGKTLGACSMRCLNIAAVEGCNMFNLNHYEKQAIDAASDRAGAFLDALGKTDLATMTENEWRDLLTTVFVAATAQIQRLSEENAVPF